MIEPIFKGPHNAPKKKCKHEWRQYMVYIMGRVEPRGFFCTKCLERRDE